MPMAVTSYDDYDSNLRLLSELSLDDDADAEYKKKQSMVASATRDGNWLVEAAKDPTGNCYVKDLIVKVKGLPDLLDKITSALATGVVGLMIHPVGSRLVPYCFQTLNYQQNQFLFQAALEHCSLLAFNQKGSESLKLCILNSEGSYRQDILKKIIKISVNLSKNIHGSSIVKFALDLHDPDVTSYICFSIVDHLSDLSVDQWGSYTVANCLKSSDGELILGWLISLGREKLLQIGRNPWGNHVVETALDFHKDSWMYHQLLYLLGLLVDEPGWMWLDDEKYERKLFLC